MISSLSGGGLLLLRHSTSFIKKIVTTVVVDTCNFFKLLLFILLFSMSGLSFGEINSNSPPFGYVPTSTPIRPLSMGAAGATNANGADILLIQSALPWNSSANTQVLNQLGYSYDSVDMSNIPTTDITKYQVVLIVNDQNQAFYDNYAKEYDKFQNYVENGGTLVFFACDHGWAGGDNFTDLPGHVKVGDNYENYNIIANASHPVITESLTAKLPISYRDGVLIDSDLDGTYASHNYFPEPLPTGADVLLKEKNAGNVTLMVYPLGKGHVIASGLTWEYTYAKYAGKGKQYGFGRALPDVFQYAFSLAGGYQKDDVSVMLYPEDQYEREGRKTLWKHPGDIMDVVARIENSSGKEQSGVKLEINMVASLMDSNQKVYVYRRTSPRIISFGNDLVRLVEGIDYFVESDKVVLNNLDIGDGQTEYVLRFRINDSLNNMVINATANISSALVNSSSILSDGGKIKLTTENKIILTNRTLFYKYFASNKDSYSYGQIEALWKTLYEVADKSKAVIYYVDKYDLDYDDDAGAIPTLQWLEARKILPYDDDPKTSLEETDINLVSNKIATLERDIIARSGGGTGRYVAILGGDEIIPFYRAYDTTGTVLDTPPQGDNIAGSVTSMDTKNGYMLTDGRYRVNSNDADSWKKGGYGNNMISVGRIVAGRPLNNNMGTILGSYRNLLLSSANIVGNSSNVVKLENLCRDGELNNYVKSAENKYSIINEIDGVTLDKAPPTERSCKTESDDATWIDLQKIFLGTAANMKDFSVMRFMTHGSVKGIQSSESVYNPYMESNNLEDLSRAVVKNALSEIKPIYIGDACLVGQIENDNNGLLNWMADYYSGGIFASSTVTWTNHGNTDDISGYNDDISLNLFSGKTTGEALVNAMSGFKNDFERMQVNLFGLPWAKLAPQSAKDKSLAYEVSGSVQNISDSSFIKLNAENNINKIINTDASLYLLKKVGQYDIISIASYEVTENAPSIPVLPLKKYQIEIPTNATDISVMLNEAEHKQLGVLRIPGMKPPAPMPDWPDQEYGYVALKDVTGIYPKSRLEYKVMKMKDSNIINVEFLPVSYNIDTGEADILTKGSIIVQYSTPDKGVADNLVIDKYEYYPSAVGHASADIENTSADTVAFNMVVKIYDLADVLVTQSDPQVVQVNSGEIGKGIIDFTVPGQGGDYRVEVVINDGMSDIAKSSTDMRIVDKEIKAVVIPAFLEKGTVANINVSMLNNGITNVSGSLKVDIYDSNQSVVVQFPQKNTVLNASGETQESFSWVVDVNLPSGNYYAKAILLPNNEDALSKNSDEFAIAQPNTGPIANDDNATTAQDQPVIIGNVLANDTDVDGDVLTLSAVDATSTQGGTVVNNGNGTFTYTPKAGFVGTDTFTYTVSDGRSGTATATVTITVTPRSNIAPVANDDAATTEYDTPVVISVLSNDVDEDKDAIAISAVDSTSSQGGSVTSNGDGTVIYTPKAGFLGVDNFTYTVTDGNGGSDTAAVSVTVNDFGKMFVNKVDVKPNIIVESNKIKISGLNAETKFSISGGEYSLNGGTYTNKAKGTIKNGDIVQVRHKSSTQSGKPVTTTLKLGKVSLVFKSTTLIFDITPDNANFTEMTGVMPTTLVESNIITVTGINVPIDISVVNGEYRINGAAYIKKPGKAAINNGDTIQVRLKSSSKSEGSVTATVTLGKTKLSFTSKTLAFDIIPDSVSFVEAAGVTPATLIESNIIAVSGTNVPIDISVITGEYRINGGAYTKKPGKGIVKNGDTVQVRHMSSTQSAKVVVTTLKLGGKTEAKFKSTTK